MECAPRRHEPGRATSGASRIRAAVGTPDSTLPGTPARATGIDGTRPGESASRYRHRQRGAQVAVRRVLSPKSVILAGDAPDRRDGRSCRRAAVSLAVPFGGYSGGEPDRM